MEPFAGVNILELCYENSNYFENIFKKCDILLNQKRIKKNDFAIIVFDFLKMRSNNILYVNKITKIIQEYNIGGRLGISG